MNKYIKHLKKINLKTIYFNFKYLPFKHAILLPIFVSNRVYLRELSGEIKFECPLRPGLIEIGYGKIGIFDNKISRSIWEVSGTVVFKGKAKIGHGSKIAVISPGKLTIGENFKISAESTIVCHSEITFGANCLLSWDILIMDTDHHKIYDNNGQIINSPKPIEIGNNVWLGCRCLILKGTSIPNNSVIGANSTVVNKLEEENALYVGSPITLIKRNISWQP